MILSSDLEKWQTSVNGINESGQKELTGEEWSALMTLIAVFKIVILSWTKVSVLLCYSRTV